MADTVNVHTKRGNREACYNARDVFYACLGESWCPPLVLVVFALTVIETTRRE